MGETRIPEQVTYYCDRCGKEPGENARAKGWVDAKIETMDRDFGGGVVYSQKFDLCWRCRRSLDEWINSIGQPIDFVFQGEGQHLEFVEVENAAGASIRVGEWVDRGDGFKVLRVPLRKETDDE